MKQTELNNTIIQANYDRAWRIVKTYAHYLHGLLEAKSEGSTRGLKDKAGLKKIAINEMVNTIGVKSREQKYAIRNHIKSIIKDQLASLDELTKENLEEVIKQLELRQKKLASVVVNISKQEKYKLLMNVFTEEEGRLDKELWAKQREVFESEFASKQDYRDRRNIQPKDRQENNPI